MKSDIELQTATKGCSYEFDFYGLSSSERNRLDQINESEGTIKDCEMQECVLERWKKGRSLRQMFGIGIGLIPWIYLIIEILTINHTDVLETSEGFVIFSILDAQFISFLFLGLALVVHSFLYFVSENADGDRFLFILRIACLLGTKNYPYEKNNILQKKNACKALIYRLTFMTAEDGNLHQ